MDRLPTIFLSHGAPDLPIRAGAVTHFLRSLAPQLPQPTAIVVISAHWDTDRSMVSTAAQPRTIHDFGGFPDYTALPPHWVQQFDDWLAQTIATGDWQALLNYRQLAPFARENHPTEEHLLPLFVALGAGGMGAQGTQLHRSYTYGAFSMAAYAFS
jgi:aromatic ring-opening dioxygenase catalytic subunit (LigB family)